MYIIKTEEVEEVMSEEMRSDIFESSKEDLLTQFSSELEWYGFHVDVDEFSFSGFYSQGDGLSFIGYIDIEEYLTVTKQKTKYRTLLRNIYTDKLALSVDIIRTSPRYYHEKTCTVQQIEEYDYLSEKCLDEIEVLRDELEEKRMGFCIRFYNILRESYESIN
jgi:hypothetical protein